MMEKSDILSQIRSARKAHISWVQRAKALVAGVDFDKEQIPVDATSCKFGSWFYEEGVRLNTLPGFEIMKEIEQLHFQLHEEYLKIFQIYFGKKESFLSKIFRFTRKKITDEEKKQAQIVLEDLEKTSQKLLDQLALLERRVEALQESVFEAL